MIFLSPWFWLTIVLWTLTIAGTGAMGGYRWAEKAYEVQRQKEVIASEQRVQRMLENNLVVVTEYHEGETKIEKVFVDRVVTKVVPHEVIVKSDLACGDLPTWLVELWNSGNKASVPDAAKGVDARPTDVVLSDVAAQHDREAELVAKEELQLARLKQWIRDQYRLVNGKDAPY